MRRLARRSKSCLAKSAPIALIACVGFAAACGDGLSGVAVPAAVDRSVLDEPCLDALMVSAASQTCANYCTKCEMAALESCRDRCSMAEVTVENLRLAEDLVCWDMAAACERADRDRCNEPEDWVDFENAIAECADDLGRIARTTR